MVRQEVESVRSLDQEDVRILLIGDQGAGKSSLIYTLANDEFEPNLPARMASITIPADLIPEDVSLLITDYSAREQDQNDLEDAIHEANVVCIVYVAGDDERLDRVAEYWLPMVQRLDRKKPIILVANKVDLIEEEGVLDRVTGLIQKFVNIEAFIEVSALQQKNVVELFSTAKNAVVYPLLPLYDPHTRVLTDDCRNALVDIFKLCDLDGDGLLSDHELNLFQENCFGTPLQRDSLDDLKSIIQQSTQDGIIDKSLTLMGFLFLHTLSIDKGRHDFTWQVLRKFNYNNQLKLKKQDSPAVDELIEEFNNLRSSSSSSSSNGSSHLNRLIRDITSMSDEEGENYSHVDISWAQEHANIVKVGLGLTLATFVSMLALRFFMHNNSRGWS